MSGLGKPKRLPPLTKQQTRRAIDHLQALYGDRALPKDPPPAPPTKDRKG